MAHKRGYEPYAKQRQGQRQRWEERSPREERRPSSGGDWEAERQSSPGQRRPPSGRGSSSEQLDTARTAELPLRLWADAGGHARALCGQRGEKSFVLGVATSSSEWRGSGPAPGVALILGAGSVAALVCDAAERPSSEQIRSLLRLPKDAALPAVLLRRCSDHRAAWHSLAGGCSNLSLDHARDLVCGGGLEIGKAFAECMIHSISSYYFRQVQEPSVKGFLSLLENAIFPRNDLYLFELLQNAVDDEATTVRFEAQNSSLRIWHDGREFSPLDVFGLSSVGFSAKSGRTIGFMGVGFKAVYKRYSRVRVRDRTWAFKFEEPSADERAARRGDGAAANGWVLMPSWDRDANRSGALERGCEFNLELPRGGRQAIAQDLAVLPRTLPPLLGRTAQHGERGRTARGSDVEPFSLTWGARGLKVQLDTAQTVDVGDKRISGNAEMVHVTDDSGREQRWVFVSRSFRQDSSAVAAFAQHTRKTYPDDQQEEFCVFFEVDQKGVPLPPVTSEGRSRARDGVIHSTLPTKLSVPMGAHIQSSWLLSIDRMDVQALTDNAWNAGLLSQLPRVCVLLLRWIAATHSGDLAHSKARFAVLPRMSRTNRKLVIDVLETAVDAGIVEAAVGDECLVPIMRTEQQKPTVALSSAQAAALDDGASTSPMVEKTVVRFVRARQAIRVPETFFAAGLSSDEIEKWLTLPPLATPALGSFSMSSLWECLPQLDSHAVRNCASNLARMLNSIEGPAARATKAIQILAAFADEGLGPEPAEGEEPSHQLPKFEQWPIFLTREGDCVSARHLSWPEEDFWRAPMVIQQLLEPHILPPRPKPSYSSGGSGGRNRGGKHNRHQQQRQKLPAELDGGHLLDSTLQRFIQDSRASGFNASRQLGVWKSAVTCVNEAKKTGATMTMDSIVKRFFEARAELRGSDLAAAVNDIVTVTAWCQQRRMAYRVSHVLTGEVPNLRLVPPRKVYIGSPYTEMKLAELAGEDVPCVSGAYDLASGLAVSVPSTRHWREFFQSIGCNEGLRFEPRCNTLQRSEYRLLPDGKAPQLRKSQKTVVLPYGLGTMTSKQLMVIDCDLSAEWQQFLAQIGSRKSSSNSDESPACNAFAALLTRLNVDTATHPDPKSTPAAGPAIAGRETDPAAASLNLIPTRRRLIYLPPGQPGALLLDLGPAQWVKRVSSSPWVCTERGLKRPAQVSLWTEREKGYRAGMPLAAVPDDLLRALKASKMATVLEFGTADPPKAMERLRELADATKAKGATAGGPACTDDELADIWRGICTSEAQGKLSGAERHDIVKLATQLPLLPGLASSPGSRVVLGRCVTAPKADPDADTTETWSAGIDNQLVESMTSVGYLVDVSSPSWALVGARETLIPLLRIRGIVRTTELGPFVGWVCETEPPMTPVLRDGLTIATHRLLQQIRPRAGRSSEAAPDGDGAALAALIGCPPKLYCKNGPQNLQSCWRLIHGDLVRPVINDDIEKASMLAKEHGFQFAGMFDHLAPSEDASEISGALHAMDKQIIARLQLPVLSSKDFAIRIQTRGEGEVLKDVQKRLSYVCDLVRMWCEERGVPGVDRLPLEVASVKRFKQIVKTFLIPGATPIKSSVWAVWRRSGAVLLCGDAEDFVAELQAEVYQRIASQLSQSGRQDFPGKVLNLLAHVESHRRFAKFLKRDHGIDADSVPALEGTIPPPEPTPAVAAPSVARDAPLQSSQNTSLPAGGGGRGRGMTIQPAWMTTGDLGKKPTAMPATDASEDSAKQAALAAELRALASQGSSVHDSSTGGRKRKAADLTDNTATFADAEESTALDPEAVKRAKGMAADFLDQMSGPTDLVPAPASTRTVPMPSVGGAGRGRGADLNKPAWMTTGDLGQPPPSSPSADSSASQTDHDALAADLRVLASKTDGGASKASLVADSSSTRRTREESSPKPVDNDSRFASLSTAELHQLLVALVGKKGAGAKLRKEKGKGRQEGLLAALRAAVPNTDVSLK